MHFPEIEWKPLPRIQFFAWLVFYVLILCFLAANFSTPTLLDNVHLPVHEAGHLLFRWFGETAELWGGTILQLLVPVLLVVAFVVRAELPGVTFCAVAFFHSLMGVATYMIDALYRELPLVTVGAASEEAEHDWARIFNSLGVLPRAIQIGNTVRFLAWCGMIATIAWFCWRYYRQKRETDR
ncbi:MAG TPA: hypothetical protein VHA33_30625 [Candidatus Angelobacter sp.]|jgi:hypothetical protein|nr:hypothetical protein [Candidatus Angelobacter sp.]